MEELNSYIKENPFFLAPMAGVTDRPFRSFMREMGCGVMTSELVSARALQEKNKRSLQLMEFDESHKPYGIQIFGEDPYIIGEGAKIAEGYGADFIDLNLGCPVSKIVKKGAGSALLKDLKQLKQILKTLKSSVKILVSLKVRTGWDHNNRNADQVARMAFEEGFEWMSVHGRTRSQAYSGKADWNYIKQLASESPLNIVGNGDLISGVQAHSALKRSSCFAVMIGRGCLNDPWIFFSAREHYRKEETTPHYKKSDHFMKNSNEISTEAFTRVEKLNTNTAFEEATNTHENHSVFQKENSKKLLNKKVKNYNQVINCLRGELESFYEERLFLLQLKKFAVWFSSGFPRSADFRKSVFQEKDRVVVIKKIEDFFTANQDFQKPPPSYEPFLMQGHG